MTIDREAPLRAKDLLRRAGLRAKKSWGQNFLCDESVLQQIAAACEPRADDVVVELGAGLGALTHFLLQTGCRVLAVERDRELVPELHHNLRGASNLSVLEQNAATVDFQALKVEYGRDLLVAGNLPYQLSGRILVSIADAHQNILRAVLLVQREVGERLAAGPGSRAYGLLSVLVQRAFATSIVRTVPPGAFHPRPKVHSAVVRLDRKRETLGPERDRLLVFAARAAFSSRRKTLKNALRGALGVEGQDVADAVQDAGLNPTARAETLDLESFLALGEALARCGLLPRHGA